MLRDAWTRHLRPHLSPETRHLTFSTDDVYTPSVDFSYGIHSKADATRCFPHFLFDKWSETGIASYSQTVAEMAEAGTHPPRDPRVIWRGAPMTPFRIAACALAETRPSQMDFRLMNWNRTDPSDLAAHTPAYVSLLDQCAYRVAIDLGAAGFSARLPLLFASGRPVILLERPCEAWFYWEMTPWVHYIPTTQQGLLETVQWTVDHPEEADRIGRQGQAYAREYLTYDAVVRRCADVVLARLQERR